jgi:hypothetical protein
MQSTSNILMIRPVAFGFNAQTADSNAFQTEDENQHLVQQKALEQFDCFVNILKANGVNVTVVNDTPEPHTPDSIFPNNWVSFHNTGDIFLYPMQAENRRLERREDIIRKLEEIFKANHVIDLSRFEVKNQFLEGTGSMVLDRVNKITYACLSPRTNPEALNAFCDYTGYKAVTFNAADQNNKAIYHTNVLMAIGSKFAIICLESIADEQEKQAVITSLKQSKKEIIEISFEQMNQFAGNMLEVLNTAGKTLIVMSQTAFDSLTDHQKDKLEKCGKLVYADISTIETNGGGSARCMIAEIHLERKD